MAEAQSFEDFEALVEETTPGDARIRRLSGDVAHLYDVDGRSAARTDWTRVSLAIGIGGLYIYSVIAVVSVLAGHIRPAGTATPLVIDPYAGAMIDVLKSVVLPVVTFMLGYYFGTGQSLPGLKAPSGARRSPLSALARRLTPDRRREPKPVASAADGRLSPPGRDPA